MTVSALDYGWLVQIGGLSNPIQTRPIIVYLYVKDLKFLLRTQIDSTKNIINLDQKNKIHNNSKKKSN